MSIRTNESHKRGLESRLVEAYKAFQSAAEADKPARLAEVRTFYSMARAAGCNITRISGKMQGQ